MCRARASSTFPLFRLVNNPLMVPPSTPRSLSCSLSPSQKGNWWTPGWPLALRGQHPQNSQMSEFRATAPGLRFRAYPCGARPPLCSLPPRSLHIPAIQPLYQRHNLHNQQKTSQSNWLIIAGSINVWIYAVCPLCFLCCIFSND